MDSLKSGAGAAGPVTFVVAFARPGLALLASDTRTTYRAYADGPVITYTDDEPKIFPYGAGWLASGPSVKWREWMQCGRDPSDAMRQLESDAPDMAAAIRERQLTVIVEPGARRALDWRGTEKFPGPQHLPVACCPNGSDPAILQQLLNTYQAEIKGLELRAVLEFTARLYAAVYAHCGPDGTVSPLLSVGLVHANGHRELVGPKPHPSYLVGEVCHA